jgi:hypothetical protein
MIRTLGFVLVLASVAGPVSAGDVIRKACLQSGRPAATSAMCSCIQSVADQFFEARDQRLAASFFKDPHKAQEIRQSDRRNHEIFWTRYKEFGAAAATVCDPDKS